jgi:hypothetical protein
VFQTSSRPVMREMSRSSVSLPKNFRTSIRPMTERTSICALNDELYNQAPRFGRGARLFESKDENARKVLKGVEDLHTYVERNREFVPNYGERYRNGEKIASGFVESAINQVVSKRMVKKQQMGWSQRGAHLLLQIRTRVLDEEWENTFRRWYPDFRPQGQAKKAA